MTLLVSHFERSGNDNTSDLDTNPFVLEISLLIKVVI